MLSDYQPPSANSLVRKVTSVLLVLIIISSGCLSEESNVESNDQSLEESIPETNPELEQEGKEIEEETIDIQENEYCDDTNTDHCMMPFPSGAFLSVDSSEITGYSLNISGEAIPDTSSAQSGNMLILDRLDGFSPSTQIFTTFAVSYTHLTLPTIYSV